MCKALDGGLSHSVMTRQLGTPGGGESSAPTRHGFMG